MANVKRSHSKVKISYGNWTSRPEAQRNDRMCNMFYEVVELAEGKEEDCNMVLELLGELKKKLLLNKVDSERKGDGIDGKHSENNCEILDPECVRSKGRPPVNRKQSTTEKFIRKRKETEAPKASTAEQDMRSIDNVLATQESIALQASKAARKSAHCQTNIVYKDQFIRAYHQYITSQTDVIPDGNCGYRVVAEAIGMGQKSWRTVRKDLLLELQSIPSLYRDLLYGPKRYAELEHALSFDKNGYAKKEYWLSMPDMGYLIATCYKVVVIFLSNTGCSTFLPLRFPSDYDDELSEFSIGFVKIGTKGHFVQVNLSPGKIPLPPVSSEWHRHKDETALPLYHRYQAREEQFTKLIPGPDTICTTQIDLDIDSS